MKKKYRKLSLESKKGEKRMQNPENAILYAYFTGLTDPRQEGKISHKLIDIVMIAISAVLSGAESWTEIEFFGEIQRKWLSTFLELPNGIPSHDTFREVFMRLDPIEFEEHFLMWVQAVTVKIKGLISIDGKQLRRSHNHSTGKKAIYMVSAWANENKLVLGQRKVDEKSNEITAIPKLLDILMLTGCIVTIDAMGCQTAIAQKIIDREGDYVLSVKKNQKILLSDIIGIFEAAEEIDFAAVLHDYYKSTEKRHGRLETRECWVISDPEYLSLLRGRDNWTGLKAIVKIKTTRHHTKTEVFRYYIASLDKEAKFLLETVRGHWGIENELHWVLDVVFKEDNSRNRSKNSAENFAVLRHIALNLLRSERSTKRSLKSKRFKCALSTQYLEKVLFHAKFHA
jgi:predicted transposase YbfD/YdcC